MRKAITFLKMLRASLLESERYTIRSDLPGMVFTQFYGWLCYLKSYALVDKFLPDIASFALSIAYVKSEGAFPTLETASEKFLPVIGKFLWLKNNSGVRNLSRSVVMKSALRRQNTLKKTIGWLLPKNGHFQMECMVAYL